MSETAATTDCANDVVGQLAGHVATLLALLPCSDGARLAPSDRRRSPGGEAPRPGANLANARQVVVRPRPPAPGLSPRSNPSTFNL